MNLNRFGIRARITVGLALILGLAVLSAGQALLHNQTIKYETTEVADASVFLLGPGGRAITGEVLMVDAGYHAVGM